MIKYSSFKVCLMKLVVGITGSTGAIYGIRMLETLKKLGIESHLIMSEWGEKCISMETVHTVDYVKSLADNVSDEKNMASSVSSGTHRIDGMIVAPCSMKTLAAIANGYDDTLVARAAGCHNQGIQKINSNGKGDSSFCNSFGKHAEACPIGNHNSSSCN